MSHHIADALKQDVPEPPRSLDPYDIIALHHHRRQRRRTAAVVGSLAIAAIAAPTALLQTDLGREETLPAAGTSAQVSALERTEPIPGEWEQALSPRELPDRATRLATVGGGDAAAYLYADGDDLCLAYLFNVSSGGVSGGTCTPADALLTQGLVSVADSSGQFTGTTRHLMIVVPDGYTEVPLGALTEPVTTNAAVFTWDYLANVDALSRSTDGLVLTGEGRPTVTIRVP